MKTLVLAQGLVLLSHRFLQFFALQVLGYFDLLQRDRHQVAKPLRSLILAAEFELEVSLHSPQNNATHIVRLANAHKTGLKWDNVENA